MVPFAKTSGYSNAIDKSGSERMRSILLGFEATNYASALKLGDKSLMNKYKKEIEANIDIYDEICLGLINGSQKHELAKTIELDTLELIDSWSKSWRIFKSGLNQLITINSYSSEVDFILLNLSVEKSLELKGKAHNVVLNYTKYANNSFLKIKRSLFLIIALIIESCVIVIFTILKSLKPIKAILNNLEGIASGDLTRQILVIQQIEFKRLISI